MSTDRRGLRYAAIGLLLGLLTIIVIQRIAETATTTAAIRKAQVTNGHTLNTSAETLRLIRDCTDPKGTCYRRGQEQTARAVASLNAGTQQAAAAATSCAISLSRSHRPVTYHSVYRCIVTTTRGPHHKP